MGFFKVRDPMSAGRIAIGSTHSMANSCGGGGGGPRGGRGGELGGSGSNYEVNRFNPVYDRLEEATVAEDWIPKDGSGLNKMFRIIYLRDPISGSAIDLYKNLPWSDFDLLGIKDPKVLQIYEDCMNAMSVRENIPEIAGEYLITGKVCTSMVFDQKKGFWTDFITHDPDFLTLTPIPVNGYDPKIDLIPSPGMRAFLNSQDPRDMDARKKLPQSFLDMMRSGKVALDPLNTLYIPRKVNPYDHIGTSILSRIVIFWALEKALINNTITSARRRSRAILQVTAGLEGVWEPTHEELNSIGGLYIQADEDPVGAVVVVRRGVEATEIRAGGDFWKLSDEWQFLSEGKMRALGINEAFLSGEANYNTMETALSVFIEQLRAFREHLTNRIFYQKIFPMLARVHGFKNTPKNQLNHRYRIATSDRHLSPHDAMAIPTSELQMPEIHWHKQLRPEADTAYLEVLEKMEEKGVPVSLRTWAAAGGMDLEKQVNMLEEDTKMRKRIAEMKEGGSTNTDAAENDFENQLKKEAGEEQKVESAGVTTRVNQLPLWRGREKVCGKLKLKEADKFLKDLKPTDNPHEKAMHFFSGNVECAEIAHYLAYRVGMTDKPQLSPGTQRLLLRNITAAMSGTNNMINKRVWNELTYLNRSVTTEKASQKEFDTIQRFSKRAELADPINNNSTKLLSGL